MADDRRGTRCVGAGASGQRATELCRSDRLAHIEPEDRGASSFPNHVCDICGTRIAGTRLARIYAFGNDVS